MSFEKHNKYLGIIGKPMTLPIWITPSGPLVSQLSPPNDTNTEGTIFSYNLDYTTNPGADLEIIAGELPPGLNMTSLGHIGGTLDLESSPLQFNFTVRITHNLDFADRTFSINVLENSAIWSTPTDLGFNLPLKPKTAISVNLVVSDPGGTQKTFQKISGTLPPGLILNSFGQILGTTDTETVTTTYNFTIRANLNASKFVDKTFNLTVVPDSFLGPVYQPRPIWLDPIEYDQSDSINFYLGSIDVDTYYEQAVYAKDPAANPLDGNTISYAANTTMPPGITIDPVTGIVSGILTDSTRQTYTFTLVVNSSKTGLSTPKVFSLSANQSTSFPLEWTTAPGLLGSIEEGAKSLFTVKATSDSPWIRYTIVDPITRLPMKDPITHYPINPLPPGLTLDILTGNIWGQAQDYLPNTGISTFNFTVKAQNESFEIYRDFSINLQDNLNVGSTRVYVTLYGPDKLVWSDLFTTPEVVADSIFREGDSQFGLIEQPKILLVENLNAPTPSDVSTVLNGVRRTYLDLGHVEVAQAVVGQEVMYEVLFRRIFDEQAGAALQQTDSVSFQTVKPGSMKNLRERLLTLGNSKGTDSLPLWMTSEQIIGKPDSILGYIPAIPFANVKPGLGQAIADKINLNDRSLKKAFMQRIRVDRIVMEPTADTSFLPTNILFDNKY